MKNVKIWNMTAETLKVESRKSAPLRNLKKNLHKLELSARWDTLRRKLRWCAAKKLSFGLRLKLLCKSVVTWKNSIFLGMRNFTFPKSGGNSSKVEHWDNDRIVAGLWFDSQTDIASLWPWERHSTLVFCWDQAVYLLWLPSLTKDLQTE